MKIILSFFCIAGLAWADDAFQLDPAGSEIRFALHDLLHTVHGSFKLNRGAIRWDRATGKATGEIVIDVASGASGNGWRDKRTHQEILESQKYPDAVFVPDSVKGRLETEGESQLDVHGVFTIHGAGHEMTLSLLVDAQGGGRYTATSHFAIPYVEWGMKDPSNFLLRVDKKVELEVKASATAH
ncbi:MAG TPA: YceI family protein [Candidatus Binataceae bacterium]|nr:YceI family protein [Candidatus Binataceae bacterium]